ncbi:phage tail protein I [Vibrio sp. YMD68]|uniref:phage tail protein I n=1 Tax=Vibrio sp. YMD68 TaxID=3042300 RepID=UPI00249A210E|nr:phage tail protein I [Vibrio sp. YMD68]WGV98823.1 phage tail protein I [Vibrio sp. YMD68]WGW01250.1 phage tail protein I [Vibrio sp. YMD68]
MSRQSLLPPHASRLLHALDKAMAAIEDVPISDVKSLWDPWNCPIDWLPWLAWAMRAREWDDEWSESQKRQYVASLPWINRIKGTRAALESALLAVDRPVQIIEWWEEEPKGPPFTFRADVNVTDDTLDQDTKQQIYRLINNTKNLRSHIVALSYAVLSRGKISLGLLAHQTRVLTIKDAALTNKPNVSGEIKIAALFEMRRVIQVSG